MSLANVVLVMFNGSETLERTDATSITAYGRLEVFLSIPDVKDPVEAARQGDALLNKGKDPSVSVNAAYDPRTAVEAPGVGWQLGDQIYVPAMDTGTPTLMPVPSYSSSTDDEGELIIEPTLETKPQVIEEQYNTYLNRLGIGLVGGTAPQASVAPDEFEEYKTGTVRILDPVTFNFPGDKPVDSQTGSAPFATRTRLNRMLVTINPDANDSNGNPIVITGATQLALYKNDGVGSGWVHVQTETIPASIPHNPMAFTITGQFMPPRGALRILKVAYGGHQDIVVQVLTSAPK